MSVSMFDPQIIRNDFPTLNQTINGYPLVYLDSAATTQKPQSVINTTTLFYSTENANVHRGRHTLSEQATTRYEQVRELTADYFNVQAKEIVWTKGATEAINLVANGLRARLSSDDIILISPIEHHANIVPWQVLAQQTGAQLKVLPMNDDATFDSNTCSTYIKNTKPTLLALTHASNALGNITDLTPLINAAKAVGAVTLIDGAQGALHLRPDLIELGCDFYVFSGHKMLGPTGVGGLYGRYAQLNALTPYQTGGEMIETVSLTNSTYRNAPAKFEAGTPNIAGVIGFGAALNYLMNLDHHDLIRYEQQLFNYAAKELAAIDGIIIYSDVKSNIGTLCFNYKNEHPYDLATLLDGYGVAVRSGHHCTQPLMTHLKINGSLRASFAFYNTTKDVEQFISAVKECIALLD